jgi:hypothetical protein
MPANRGEILVATCVLRVFRLQRDGAAEVLDGGFVLTRECLDTGEVVEQARIVRVRLEPPTDGRPRRAVVAAPPGRDRLGHPLPRRRLVWAAWSPADRERRRVRLGRDRRPPCGGVADEDDCPCRRVELVSRDRKARRALEDDVELFVATGPGAELVVLLDQLVSRRLGPVRVDAESGDAQWTAERLPLELPEGRQRLDLGQAND